MLVLNINAEWRVYLLKFRFGNYCIDSVNSWDSCPGMKMIRLAKYERGHEKVFD